MFDVCGECRVVVSYVACRYVLLVCVNDNVSEVFCGSIYGREGVNRVVMEVVVHRCCKICSIFSIVICECVSVILFGEWCI